MRAQMLDPSPLLILDAVNQPALVAGCDGRIRFANSAAAAALEFGDRSKLANRELNTIMTSSRTELRGALTQAVCGQKTDPAAATFTRKDGSTIAVEWQAKPIDLPGEQHVVISFTDRSYRTRTAELEEQLETARRRAADALASQRRLMAEAADVRQRTARDLHDGAQQRLVTLAILLQLASEHLPEGSGEAGRLLSQAAGEAKAAIDELRELAAGVYPAALSLGGLPAAVDSLAMRSPVPIAADVCVPSRLDRNVEVHTYFVICEALTNAVKHAAASQVDVVVRAGRCLEVVISDDGVGGVDAAPRGAGLAGMFDRAAALGGELVISSSVGCGTSVRLTVPLAPVDCGVDPIPV